MEIGKLFKWDTDMFKGFYQRVHSDFYDVEANKVDNLNPKKVKFSEFYEEVADNKVQKLYAITQNTIVDFLTNGGNLENSQIIKISTSDKIKEYQYPKGGMKKKIRASEKFFWYIKENKYFRIEKYNNGNSDKYGYLLKSLN